MIIRVSELILLTTIIFICSHINCLFVSIVKCLFNESNEFETGLFFVDRNDFSAGEVGSKITTTVKRLSLVDFYLPVDSISRPPHFH